MAPIAALAAWEASVEVTAAAYGLDPNLLKMAPRGRGPRPPRATWEARKMAFHVAVMVAGCSYVEVGRLLGLHKDTAASHCAAMRDACADSDELEQLSEALELCARIRLALSGVGATALRSAA